MYRLLASFLLLFSFSSHALIELGKSNFDAYGTFPKYCSSVEQCYTFFPDEFTSGSSTFYRCQSSTKGNGSIRVDYKRFHECPSPTSSGGITAISFIISETDEEGCFSSQECFPVAKEECSADGKELKEYTYISPNTFTKECSDTPDASKECENTIISYCANNFGMASSSYTDDGAGTTSCTGVCTDGSNAAPDPDCNLANNYCDVPDPDSDLDFGSGGTGSSVGDSSSTTADTEHDIDYDADGSSSDSVSSMSSLQGDKLINEVIATRNDNTTNLASTSKTTNETIVEKSDDISSTVSNSANGIIDAVNDITPFYDGNIVDAIKDLNSGSNNDGVIGAIDSLSDEFKRGFDTKYTSDRTYENLDEILFGQPRIDHLVSSTTILESQIRVLNHEFSTSLKSKVNFQNSSNGYQANNLDIGKWGSFDVSISRFAEFFGGIGNIIYFLASITALSIVLGGVKL
jgi:hypothetical protein